MADADRATATPVAVVTTCATRDEALRIAHALVERRLAACVQLSAIDSVYRWDGQVQQDPEVRLVVKTLEARYSEVERAIRELHPYALPQIVAVRLDHALPAYADWIVAECTAGGAADGAGG
ncbi:divalent-cation tolerance protein CutA [Azohydromonas sediminis]|uniref:divalent-cation tolerance protein CutA n=1 Tax=Azohydromonas sediminis TaxID=2259674 RepID=UPI000E64AE37|nr:divalent-cation tolerance protein CutA [Azohydromonas sediminis]